jgi:hypothetical protein
VFKWLLCYVWNESADSMLDSQKAFSLPRQKQLQLGRLVGK